MLFQLPRALRIALFCVVVTFLQRSVFGVNDTSGRALLTAVACDTKPDIDGELTDTAWLPSAKERLFAKGRDHGYIALCHDDKQLYLAMSCTERNPYSVTAPIAQRDSDVRDHESVEVLIRPADNPEACYRFGVSAANVQFDSRYTGRCEDTGWNGNWTSATSLGHVRWAVEIAIPFSDLAVSPPSDGTIWELNIVRNRVKGNSIERISWNPRNNNDHKKPGSLGLLRFSSSKKVAYVTEHEDFFAGKSKRLSLWIRGSEQGRARLWAGSSDKPELVKDIELNKYRTHLELGLRFEDQMFCVEIDDDSGQLLYSSGYMPVDIPEGLEDIQNSLVDIDDQNELQQKLDAKIGKIEQAGRLSAHSKKMWNDFRTEFVRDIVSYRFLQNGPAGKDGKPDYGLATASSMTKVLPKEPHLFSGEYSKGISLSAARNEREAHQVVILSPDKDLQNVTLEWTDLTSPAGDRIKKSRIAAASLGYVKTQDPPYPASYTGWWPDPILSYMDGFTIAKGDLHSLWYSVDVPADAKAGAYEGSLRISPADCAEAVIPVRLRVWDFGLPKETSLKTAVNISVINLHHKEETPERIAELRTVYERFLAEHRTALGSIYQLKAPPDEATLTRWAELGTNTFNVFSIRKWHMDVDSNGNFVDLKPEYRDVFTKQIADTLAIARKLGIEDKAYLYAFDERIERDFEGINRVTSWLKSEFPNLPIMTTSPDPTYGKKLTSVDMFVPLSMYHNRDRAETMRRREKQVWWYVYAAPHRPYASMLIEKPGIDPRILLGFMSYAYQVDGFLYYSMSRMTNNSQTLQGGPYTTWNTRSWGKYNGDGHLLYPHQTGPVTSIRMENWLDGLEDYEYLNLLQQRIEQLYSNGQTGQADRICEQFREYALPGNNLVQSKTVYIQAPDQLERVRAMLAELIVQTNEVRE